MKKSLTRKVVDYLTYSICCFLGGLIMVCFAPVAGIFAYRHVRKKERAERLKKQKEALLTDDQRAQVQGNESLDRLFSDSKQGVQKKIWRNILEMDYDELRLMSRAADSVINTRAKNDRSKGTKGKPGI